MIVIIDTNELRGMIAKKHLSQAQIAKAIGITPKTFYDKMKKGVFNSDEIQIMIECLDIKEPTRIFFANRVS